MNFDQIKSVFCSTDSKACIDQATIDLFLESLESGQLRVVTYDNQGRYQLNSWVQQAIVTVLSQIPSHVIAGYPQSYDKLSLQVASDNKRYRQVPGALVRRGAYIGDKAILMPSFINIGAFVGNRTMIDTWATVGSCAYVGHDCHISGGTGLGGVLEPVGSVPVIVEDHVFVGARCEIAEGVHIGHHSVIASGVFLTKTTKIYNRMTGQTTQGHIPPYSVVVPGSVKLDENASIAAAIIVKMRDKKTDSKVSLNDALRATL